MSRDTDARPRKRRTSHTASMRRNCVLCPTSVAIPAGWRRATTSSASAKDVIGRPQLQQLLHDAAAGKFDLVLVARIDRWSRNLADLLDTVSFLEKHGVAFHSATEHFDTTSPMGKMILSMLGMFAEFERAMIIDRIIRGGLSHSQAA